MGILNFFREKKLTHIEKVSMAYSCYKADTVNMIFPEGIHQADIIIRSLAKIYGLKLDSLNGKDYYNILTTYTDILIRKVVTNSDDNMIVSSLKVKHSDLIKSSQIAHRVLAYTTLNMLNHSFAIENEKDLEILLKLVESENQNPPKDQGDIIEEGYYFETILELAIYGKLFGTDRTINWLSGDLYLKQYQQGFQLVEEGKYEEAIKVLKSSLLLNPIGISSRFEICECLILLKDFSSAEDMLYDMGKYLLDPKHIAKFYRRIGYIQIEKRNYLSAAACYVYSKNFECHPTAEQELQYISSISGVKFDSILNNPIIILQRYNIPILKNRSINDIAPPGTDGNPDFS